jgi:branched-chain amino acid transport system permease protein
VLVSRLPRLLRFVDSTTPVVALIALVGLVSGATLLGNSLNLQRQAITMLVYVVIVVGLYVFVGNSGVLSFGHITFVIVGAYVTAFSTIPPTIKHAVFAGLPNVIADMELSPLLGLLLGACVAALVALLVAFPINRLPGITLGLAMFALLLTTNVVTRQATARVTGGQTSVFGIPGETTMLSAFLFASVAIVVAYVYQGSRAGLLLRAAREDEFAARASGINIARSRLSAFLLSAFLMGLGGGLFVQFLGALNPDTFFFESTLITLAMLVVGGIGSLSGAVIGTVVLSVVLAWLHELENGFRVFGLTVPPRPGLTAVGLGAVMLLILVLRPRGLTGSKEILPSRWNLRWLHRPRAAPPSASTSGSDSVEPDREPVASADGGPR